MKSICVIKSRKPSTTSQIYEKREGRTHTEYRYYPQNDTTQLLLDECVAQYKKETSIKNKKKIIKAEKQLLLEEFQNPELTLVRRDKSFLEAIKRGFSKNKFFNWLTLCNANGFYRIIALSPQIGPKFTDKDCLILKDAFENIREEDEYGIAAKKLLIRALEWKDKTSLVKGLAKNPNLLEIIDGTTYNIKEIAKKIRSNNYTTEDLEIFLKHNHEDNKEIKKIKADIIKILKDRKISSKKRQIAIWGAGKFKSEEAYKILKRIVKNKDEKDITLREFALHSLAFYIRQHPEEVKKILGEVEKENSIFSPLAKILKSKVEGRYHFPKDRPFIERGMTPKDIKGFLSLKRKIIDKKSSTLNIMEENKFNESLLEYENPLKKLLLKKFKIGITDETATRLLKGFAGKRIFYEIFDNNQGDFEDTVTGRSSYQPSPYILISTISLARPEHDVIKHELAHQIQEEILSPKEHLKSIEIFQKSCNNRHTLPDYALTNFREYFACAMDAFLSPYRAHEELLNRSASRYQLMVKDKRMFNFLQKIYDKYFKS